MAEFLDVAYALLDLQEKTFNVAVSATKTLLRHERKTGRWNNDGSCSVCGHCDWDCVESKYFHYCPNCGAKMVGGGE